MNYKIRTGLEGAQHGSKPLPTFIDFAKKAGASGVQPTNYMLQDLSVSEIKEALDSRGMKIYGISIHCLTYVLLAAHTGTLGIMDFIPAGMRHSTIQEIEEWAERAIIEILNKGVELGVFVYPMFWGPMSLELSGGYPWGFFKGPGYDLVKSGLDFFVKKTEALRILAGQLGAVFAHEVHPGTAAICADDFLALVEACDDDPCLRIIADPSHCWMGEDFDTRFRKVGDYIVACHVKDHKIISGKPLLSMESDWKKRGMRFTALGEGDLDLFAYVELMIEMGYPEHYCELMHTNEVPLVVEAESAYMNLDETSKKGIEYVNEKLCFEVASGSFQDEMGAEK